MNYRVVYAILWLLTVIAYSIPWATANGQTFVGWNFTMPFSITYLIGIILGLVVLITRYKPVVMTIVAGILMLLGIAGADLGLATASILTGIVGGEAKAEAGMGLAFIVSIIYTVLGAYVGKKLIVRKTN